MKSIYNQDDLRCNAIGLQLRYEAETFLQSILERYPDYDPRELAGLFSGEFHIRASRRILELRRAGILKEDRVEKPIPPKPEIKSGMTVRVIDTRANMSQVGDVGITLHRGADPHTKEPAGWVVKFPFRWSRLGWKDHLFDDQLEIINQD
jgi:hypothetical protein